MTILLHHLTLMIMSRNSLFRVEVWEWDKQSEGYSDTYPYGIHPAAETVEVIQKAIKEHDTRWANFDMSLVVVQLSQGLEVRLIKQSIPELSQDMLQNLYRQIGENNGIVSNLKESNI